jgi:hypothetical protein
MDIGHPNFLELWGAEAEIGSVLGRGAWDGSKLAS